MREESELKGGETRRSFAPEEILAYRFTRARRRGYDTIQVDDFMAQLSGYVARLQEDLANQQSSERAALALLQNAQFVADETMVAAERSSERFERDASAAWTEVQAEAAGVLHEARTEAGRIEAVAQGQASRVIAAAREAAAQIMAEAQLRLDECNRRAEHLSRIVDGSAFDLRSGAARLAEMADQLQFESAGTRDHIDLRNDRVGPQ